MNSRKLKISPCFPIAVLFLICSLAHAATFKGTVTNKTTNKPSSGDTVTLIDVQAGMAEAASATTNSAGSYTLESPTVKSYLVRANHQGATYFIAAPQEGSSGDITVYDVAAKVDGLSLDADMLLVEAGGGMLRIQERYMIRNRSLPPKAQFSDKTFEIVLPADAELDGAASTRPGGMSTNTTLVPLGQKGHYTFNVPIQPDKAEKETMFEVQYHISYSGKYTFTPHPQMTADNLVVYVAPGIKFAAGSGSSFQSTQEDPRVQTYVAKSVHPGQTVAFTVSGEGQMPRDAQASGNAGMGDAGGADSGRPGGGIGVPIGSPDPLTKYKWWILGGLALLLAGAAVFLLKGKGLQMQGVPAAAEEFKFESSASPRPARSTAPQIAPHVSNQSENEVLMNVLKEELFAIESEKLAGTLSMEEYAAIKIGLEAVLKRALRKG